jgi:hypothetical protein
MWRCLKFAYEVPTRITVTLMQTLQSHPKACINRLVCVDKRNYKTAIISEHNIPEHI